MSIVNNVVLKADLMRKANDWTSTTVSNHQGLTGMGYIFAGEYRVCQRGRKMRN